MMAFPPPKNKHTQCGNMLIYILGAIFLLGLLLVILKGNVQEGAGIDSDKITVRVQQIFTYANELERGVRNVTNNNAYGENDIRFGHPDSVVNYGLITSIPARQVFDETGGGVEYKTPPTDVNDGTQWQFYATTHIPDMGTDTPADSRAELLAVLPNVTRAVCERINLSLKQAINLNNDTDSAANGCVHASGTPFTGTFVAGASANSLTTVEIPKHPAYELCVRCNGGTFHYYRVLLSR